MAVGVHDPIGSVWRVWDLHFHTPSSYDYKNKSVTNKDMVDTLVNAGVSVVAITDHHLIDVQRIRDLQILGQGKLVVLPGIEVRTELGGADSIHMVAVFPEDNEINAIWDKLRVSYSLVQQVADRGNDAVYVDFREFADDVHKLNGLTIIHAGSKANSIEEIANSTAFKMALKTDLAREASDIFEIANPKNIPSFTDVLKSNNIAISMDGKGRVFDNIFIERLWRTVKYEEVYLKDYADVGEVTRGLSDFFRRYNEERPHSALGDRTPYEVYHGVTAPQPTLQTEEGIHLKRAS